ncbi:MAG TPA: hypothetical protein VKZ63_18715 [Kofleriaceae bacterium]|nr:hypothetical protein [Kofleriaceae bacterium]
MPRLPAALLLALGAALLPPAAAAHVAPSARENNRYLTLTPLGDRVRLAYVVYIGEEPGRRARARMDRDRSGRIDADESAAYAGEIAAEVAARVEVAVDGRALPLRFSEVHIGLGDDGVGGGSFAIDLVAWICLERPREHLEHELRLVDRFEIPAPGESELRVDPGPGVSVTSARFASDPAGAPARLERRWRGGPGPAAGGYQLSFTVDPSRAPFSDQPCAPAPARDGALWPYLVAAAALMTSVGLLALRRSRSAGRAS